jgi:hypothetical protein
MDILKTQTLLQEFQNRVKSKAERLKFTLEDHCFDKQLAFVTDPAKFKTAVCSRRAGKSEGCGADLWFTASNHPGVNCLYITLSRKTAKKIIWRILLKLQRKYDPKAKIDNVELTIELTNGSLIMCSGAKDESEIEKFRGMAFKKVYIDEAQAFKSYLKELISDVIEPALYDYDGSLALIGTPNASCSGVFYDACNKKPGFDGWANHHWTIHDNPHILAKSGKTPAQHLSETLKRKGITEADPSFQRESLGKWVYDGDTLMFKYDAKRNTYKELPADCEWHYILGVDIGWNDADALAVLAFSPDVPQVYMVEELIQPRQTISDLATSIKILQSKYTFMKMVIDAGALGKKIQEEIRQRHGIHMEAAEKSRKAEFIELMNDDLRRGMFLTKPEFQINEDFTKLQWDKSNKDRWKEDNYFHSDISDATLYAWRTSKHYGYEPPKPVYKRESEEFMHEQEALEEARAASNPKEWWDDGFENNGFN